MRRGLLGGLLGLALIGTVQAQPAGEAGPAFGPFVESGFPFITTTLDAAVDGGVFPERNLAVRCLALVLDDATYACFDTDLLRVAAAWSGDFMALTGMPHVSYHEAGNKKNEIPRITGDVFAATGIYPGWSGGAPVFVDPRPAGPNPAEIGRGPIAASEGRWDGVEVLGGEAVLRYTVRGAGVREVIRAVPDGRGIARTIEVQPHAEALTLVLGEWRNPAHVEGNGRRLRIHHGGGEAQVRLYAESEGPALRMEADRYAVLHLPVSSAVVSFQVIVEAGAAGRRAELSIPDLASARTLWDGEVTTHGVAGAASGPYAIDDLTLPVPNPWRRNVRVSGIGFFDDGRAALSTFEGDVWLLAGIDDGLQALRWTRFASGLCEPMSLSVVDGHIYVFGREGIVRLVDRNGDGEADFYENFSNLPVQTGESREYPLSMRERPGGGFLVAKGSALNNGPSTSPAIMPGFRAGGPHSGAIVAVSADGRRAELFASGLREPYLGVHPETGLVTASDQQGNFVPSTPIYVIEPGAYHGVPASAHGADTTVIATPLLWIPHRVDRSGAEQVWVTSDRMGPLNGALVHQSYGQPGIYRIYIDERGRQGGIMPLPGVFPGPTMKGRVNPADGQLYIAGFQVWDSSADRVSALVRYRYTGQPDPMPAGFVAGAEGVVLSFSEPVQPMDAGAFSASRWNYHRTSAYGSGFFKQDGTPGQETMRVLGVHPSNDGRSVFVQIDDMAPTMQFALGYGVGFGGSPVADTLYLTVHNARPLDLSAFDAASIARAAANTTSSGPATAEAAPTVDRGRALYEQWGCAGCHSIDGSTAGKTGPTFKGLYGASRFFTDGTFTDAGDAYLRRSMYRPDAQVVSGFQVAMQSYEGVLSEGDVASLILFIKSLTP
ncbi:MAG: cytochrome c [Rhodothermales bacterium]